MENTNKEIGALAENSSAKKTIVSLYLVFLLALGIIAISLYVTDYNYESNYLASFGVFIFLAFYLISTAFVIWLVRTNKSNSLWADAWKRLLKNKLAVFGLVVIWFITLLVSVGPSVIYWVTGFTADYIPSNVGSGELVKSFPPSLLHPMGTDEAGRDLFARVLQGGRISLMVGIISTIVSLIVGVSYGAIAGYLGGRIDNFMMRVVDIIYSIPYILIVIVLLFAFSGNNITALIQVLPFIILGFIGLILFTAGFIELYKKFSPKILTSNNLTNEILVKIATFLLFLVGIYLGYQVLVNSFIGGYISMLGKYLAERYVSLGIGEGVTQIFLLFFAIGFISWLTMARVVRGQILSLKNQEFVLAAKATGVSTPSIIFRHLVPNVLGPVIVYATLTIPQVMLSEAFLSFLGIGVQAPYASWGSLVSDGIKNISIFPWQLIFPGVTMALTLFSLNFLGDGLRDALDPQTRKF